MASRCQLLTQRHDHSWFTEAPSDINTYPSSLMTPSPTFPYTTSRIYALYLLFSTTLHIFLQILLSFLSLPRTLHTHFLHNGARYLKEHYYTPNAFALITGSTDGIGRAFALELADRGVSPTLLSPSLTAQIVLILLSKVEYNPPRPNTSAHKTIAGTPPGEVSPPDIPPFTHRRSGSSSWGC